MQRNLDEWLNDDWEKNTQDFEEKGKESQKEQSSTRSVAKEEATASDQIGSSDVDKADTTTEKEDESFTLQHYVDKIKYYNVHKQKSDDLSHVQELEKMPVIGK